MGVLPPMTARPVMCPLAVADVLASTDWMVCAVCHLCLRVVHVAQLKFEENFDDILDEGSSTRTPVHLPEWACA